MRHLIHAAALVAACFCIAAILAGCGGGGAETMYCETVFVDGNPGQVCSLTPPQIDCPTHREVCK